MREPSAQGTVTAVTNCVRHPVNTRYCGKNVHTDHISQYLSDPITRPDAASAGALVEKLPQRYGPPHHGHADGTTDPVFLLLMTLEQLFLQNPRYEQSLTWHEELPLGSSLNGQQRPLKSQCDTVQQNRGPLQH